MGEQAAYRELCSAERSIPLFQQAWWLDATCGEAEWDAVLVRKGQEVHAALPFRHRSVRGFVVLSQPALTQFLGPWLRDTGAKKANDYSRQKELMTELIQALPDHAHYVQNWSPAVTNWLPFYWKDFSQTTAYTYVLKDLTNTEAIWAQLRENIRREIRRAQNRAGISVDADAPLEDFLKLNALTFARQDKARPYTEDYVRRLDAACTERNCRRIFVGRDQEGRLHSAAYVVWDAHSAYYLMGGGDPELRNSGAMSLCMWEAIRFASGVTERFDFEGSMIEPIERFFRSFGAEQVPYFHITRTPSRLLRAGFAFKSLLSRK